MAKSSSRPAGLLQCVIVMVAFVVGGTGVARAGGEGVPGAAPLVEQYTMLYYKDIAAARNFYGDILGLEATFSDEWVTLYRVVPGALLGVVREGGTAFHPARAENSVMLSLVTEDVDRWHARLRAFPGVRFLKSPYDHEKVPIRAMLVTDPGGYTVEFFQWREPAAQ